MQEYPYKELEHNYDYRQMFVDDMTESIQKATHILGSICADYNADTDTHEAILALAGITKIELRAGGSVFVKKRVPDFSCIEVSDDTYRLIHNLKSKINQLIDSLPNKCLRSATYRVHGDISIRLGIERTPCSETHPLTKFYAYGKELKHYGIEHVLGIDYMEYIWDSKPKILVHFNQFRQYEHLHK